MLWLSAFNAGATIATSTCYRHIVRWVAVRFGNIGLWLGWQSAYVQRHNTFNDKRLRRHVAVSEGFGT